MSGLRVALLGFSIECNRFAPPATGADFRRRAWFEGEAMLTEARAAAPRIAAELPGFVAEMDAAGPWQPLPLLLAATEPNGPVEHAAFVAMMGAWEAGLREAGPLDAVYCVLHGAGLTTEDDDPAARCSAWCAAWSGRTCRWLRPSTCTPTCPRRWSPRSTPRPVLPLDPETTWTP